MSLIFKCAILLFYEDTSNNNGTSRGVGLSFNNKDMQQTLKVGDTKRAACSPCKSFQNVTFQLRNTPFSDGSGLVRLVGVCNACDSVVVLPHQHYDNMFLDGGDSEEESKKTHNTKARPCGTMYKGW